MMLVDLTHRLPRTTTRAQWKTIHHRRRVLNRRLRSGQMAMLERLREMHNAYGRDLAEIIANPPVVIFPDQTGAATYDLSPGKVNNL